MIPQNPLFTNIKLDMRLTQDDNGKDLLYIEHCGYFPIPPHVLSQLEKVMGHFSREAESDLCTRFVLHAMLSNQK